jgi:hypothetical protein
VEVRLHFDWFRGLGTELCAFSAFVNSGTGTLFVAGDPNYHNFSRYKKIFNVSDSQLHLKKYSEHSLDRKNRNDNDPDINGNKNVSSNEIKADVIKSLDQLLKKTFLV